jgi:hypothetical protein
MEHNAGPVYIDLTVDVEQCTKCSAVLGRGDGKKGLIFLLKDCLCVIIPQLDYIHNVKTFDRSSVVLA